MYAFCVALGGVPVLQFAPVLQLPPAELTQCGFVSTVKFVADVPVPPPVVTLIGPVVAPDGTVAVICVSPLTVNVAALVLNVTAVAPVKPVPLMTTVVPTGPLVGLKLVTETLVNASSV